MTTLSATKARENLFDLVKGASKRHQIYRIHHRSGDVVLMSEAEYESLVETLELLSVPGFRESIRRSLKNVERGETYSLDEVLGSET